MNEPLIPAELLILAGIVMVGAGVFLVLGVGAALVVLGMIVLAVGAVAWSVTARVDDKVSS